MKNIKFKRFRKIPYPVCIVRGVAGALFGQVSEKDGKLDAHFFSNRQSYLTSYFSDTFILLTKQLKAAHADIIRTLCEYHEVENDLREAKEATLESLTPPADPTDRQAVRNYRRNKSAISRQQSELDQRISEAKKKRIELIRVLTELRQQDKDLLLQSHELFVKAEQCTERQMSAYTQGATLFRRFKGCKPPVLIINTTPEKLYLDTNIQIYDEVNRIIEQASIAA